ncbi:MAG: dephospho-CoA kinase [Parvularculaceae bacterium]
MMIVGLTGSIGMGKSTVTAMFAEEGAAVWNADDAVHRLYAPGGAGAKAVSARFPSAIVDGGVDREKLSALVLNDKAALADLEAIIHPLVGEDRGRFLEEAMKDGADIAVLDIPLLFEKNYENFFDAIVVVSAPFNVQRARVLARDGMTPEKLEAILSKQTPDSEKRRRADFVIDTSAPIEETRREVRRVYRELKDRPAI